MSDTTETTEESAAEPQETPPTEEASPEASAEESAEASPEASAEESAENGDAAAPADDGQKLELAELDEEEALPEAAAEEVPAPAGDMGDMGDAGDMAAALDLSEPRDPVKELDAIYDIPVQVSAVLGKATMQVSQLLKLGRGAVVELDRKVGEAIDIYVNNRLVARGEVVVVDERLGVTMTEIIKSDQGR